MNLLKTVIDDLGEILKKNGVDETVDIRISNIDNYDYQINNLVKHQNHPNVDFIKEEISAPNPPVIQSSCNTNALPVFFTDSKIISESEENKV